LADAPDARRRFQRHSTLVRDGYFRCHGFCLMPTHYHLLAWFPEHGGQEHIFRDDRDYSATS
jgi:hypothetical protein